METTVHHKKHHWRNRILTWSTGIISIIAFLLILLFFVAKFFDANRVYYQNPIVFLLKTPIVIVKRFTFVPVPKAEYVDVNPLTTPQEIDTVIKNHGTFDYAQTASLATIQKQTIKDLIHNKVVQKWGEESWKEIDYIITHESGYDPYIVNKGSGACGIFQALPCSKLPSLDITDQINWGIQYIAQRYQTPDNAYQFKKGHGWY